DYVKLREFVNKEIYILLVDKSYSMIKRLRMHRKIKFNKDGVCLFTDGFYFDKREAITFKILLFLSSILILITLIFYLLHVGYITSTIHIF
ncbi:hypothetical protein LCGC14_2221220, partial [marine sediment metagenome]